MSQTIQVFIWIGVIAFILFIACAVLYYLWKNGKLLKEEHNTAEDADEKKLVSKNSYTSNERLDGARVSHRRTHPDRLEEETRWKENREQDRIHLKSDQRMEENNNLFMIYSPCNGDVIAIRDRKEVNVKEDIENPSIVLQPHDETIYVPVSGVIEASEDNKMITIHVENGLDICLTAVALSQGDTSVESLVFQTIKTNRRVMRITEPFLQLPEGIIKKGHKSVQIILSIKNTKHEQLILFKRSHYVLKGDKLVTIRIDSQEPD